MWLKLDLNCFVTFSTSQFQILSRQDFVVCIEMCKCLREEMKRTLAFGNVLLNNFNTNNLLFTVVLVL